jgi:hypothetical protein
MGISVSCDDTVGGENGTWSVNLNQLACALEAADLNGNFTGVTAVLCVDSDCTDGVAFIPGCDECVSNT